MVTIIATEVVENNRNYVGWVLLAVVDSIVFECQVALAVCSSSVLSRKMVVFADRLLCSKRLLAN